MLPPVNLSRDLNTDVRYTEYVSIKQVVMMTFSTKNLIVHGIKNCKHFLAVDMSHADGRNFIFEHAIL